MVIPKGYKQTEVGVIPEDWDISSLENEYTLSAGGDLNRNDYSSHKTSETKFCIYSNSLTNNGIYGFCKNPKHVGNSITITGRGDIGHAEYREAPFSAIIRLLVCEPKKEINSFYVASFLNLTAPFPIESTGVPQLTVPQIKKVKIPLPGIEEQNCISEYISDIDDFLSTIKKLLAKKKAIKQGAMQELLTGKRRLPGFTGDWIVKELGDISPLQRGFDLTQAAICDGKYPVVFSNGIGARHNRALVKGPGVVTGRSGTIGKVHFIQEDFWPHNTTLWVTNFKGNDPLFIYYLLNTVTWNDYMTGSGVPTLNRNDVHKRQIVLPADIAEQEAIAQVLADLDNEIAGLEHKLAKYRQVKQGMMQQLLTGKIRLNREE